MKKQVRNLIALLLIPSILLAGTTWLDKEHTCLADETDKHACCHSQDNVLNGQTQHCSVENKADKKGCCTSPKATQNLPDQEIVDETCCVVVIHTLLPGLSFALVQGQQIEQLVYNKTAIAFNPPHFSYGALLNEWHSTKARIPIEKRHFVTGVRVCEQFCTWRC